MRGILLLLVAVGVAWGADDPWNKVREIKSGSELRIFKKSVKQPLLAKFDEADAERLLVVVRNEQVAIAREDIDRLDCRPQRSGGRVTKETRTSSTNSEADKNPLRSTPGPSSSTSTSVAFPSKADFETVYRRAPGTHR